MARHPGGRVGGARSGRLQHLNACFEFRGRGGQTIRAFTFAAGLNDLLRLVEAPRPGRPADAGPPGYARVGRPFPALPDEPVLEARQPRF